MSTLSKRVQTIKVIVASSVIGSNSIAANKVKNELNAIENAGNISAKPRRLLLQMLHSTRALDTSLSCFCNAHTISAKPSLGGYLHGLTIKGPLHGNKLSISSKQRYQQAIVDKRNKLMHEADAYPASDNEFGTLLTEMQCCLFEVLSL